MLIRQGKKYALSWSSSWSGKVRTEVANYCRVLQSDQWCQKSRRENRPLNPTQKKLLELNSILLLFQNIVKFLKFQFYVTRGAGCRYKTHHIRSNDEALSARQGLECNFLDKFIQREKTIIRGLKRVYCYLVEENSTNTVFARALTRKKAKTRPYSLRRLVTSI